MSSSSQRSYYREQSGSSMNTYKSMGASNSCAENLPPKTLSKVAREIRDLHRNPPEGVRLVLDDNSANISSQSNSLSEIMAELEGPTDTPYEKRYFQLKLCLPPTFPSNPPRGYFLTKIYHPNVDTSNGSICVNTLKKDWTANTTLSHVLSVIRCLLIVPFPESSLNDEAGKLFMESYDEFARRARLMSNVHGRSSPCSSYLLSEKKSKGGEVLENVSKNGNTENIMKESNHIRDNKVSKANAPFGQSSAKAKSKKLQKKKSLKRL
mmetsp:Transcript_56059/g.65480  ORF Transcript_56059/g.65480 Transcript_56059/m.65480 type:complete len:266 (+) Transcript_56059:141-938(+)